MKVSPKIIALWTAPRSISSAFERCFSQRSDTQTFFEPYFNIFHFSQWRQDTRLGEYAKARAYSPARAEQKLRGASRPFSFFKEMAFIYWPYLDREFLRHITNTFLIRRPEFSLNGWLKMGQVPTEEMLGFGKLGTLWRLVTEELGQPSIVVEASKFQNDPEGTLRRYCGKLGMDFDPRMLSWEQREHLTWDKELMTDETWTRWQKTLNNSTGILPASESLPQIPTEHLHLLGTAFEVYNEISRHAV